MEWVQQRRNRQFTTYTKLCVVGAKLQPSGWGPEGRGTSSTKVLHAGVMRTLYPNYYQTLIVEWCVIGCVADVRT
jgi:hypothetical protein